MTHYWQIILLVALVGVVAYYAGRTIERERWERRPWQWSRERPLPQIVGGHLVGLRAPPMPGMKTPIIALDAAAEALSRYLVSPGAARDAIADSRQWLGVAEALLLKVEARYDPASPPPPPPPPPPPRTVHEASLD